MTKEEAINKANGHIKELNLKNEYSDIMNWAISEIKEYEHSYYFDYKFEIIKPNSDIEFGGAPGFMISKEDGTLNIVSWSELKTITE